MDSPIRNLTIHDICIRAKRAVDLCIPHDEANSFKRDCENESHMHAAFKGAYDDYAKQARQPQAA